MFRATRSIALDTETTGLRPWHGDRPFAVSMCNEDGDTWYTEWPVDPFTRRVTPNLADLDFILRVLSSVENMWAHNAKFDIRMLSTVGLEIPDTCVVQDMLIAARVCNTLELTYRLKPLAKKYAQIPDDDENILRKHVASCRRQAQRLGWSLHEDLEADYWVPRALDPENDLCETYAVRDAIRTIVLGLMYGDILANDPDLANTYRREMELFPIVMQMEERGVAIYPERNEYELQRNTERMQKNLDELRRLAKRDDFNPRSPVQLSQVMFSPESEGGYGLQVFEYTEKGAPSTSWKAIRPHSSHPFVRVLLSYRASEKAINTFFLKYKGMMVPDPLVPGGYCVHPWFNQSGAKTGRFSCQEPNLQQVADSRGFGQVQARGPFGPRLNAIVIRTSSSGKRNRKRVNYRFYLFDYSQQESRIFAEVSGIKEMQDALLAGRDINTECANRAWGGKGNEHALQSAAYTLELGSEDPQNIEVLGIWKDIGWSKQHTHYGVTSPEAFRAADRWLSKFDYDMVKADASVNTTRSRTRAKIILFCKIYGGGAAAVKDLLYCSMEEARATMARFDEVFPGINEFIARVSEQGRRQGYVQTLYGRKLHTEWDFAYRAANYIVQGTAADMMKDSITRVHRFIESTKLDAHIVMTVHDELAVEVNVKHSYVWFLRRIKDIMEDNEGRMKIPMIVECKRAVSRWDEKEKVEL